MKYFAAATILLSFYVFASQVFAQRTNSELPPVEIPDPVDMTVAVPGGGTERIYLQVPASQPENRPLILIFHGAYFEQHWNNPHDPLQDELRALFAEAARRGWYAVSINGGEAPLVGTYAGPELHKRATAVLGQLQALYQVNPRQIYTVGYSMGGVDAVNYAARHVDPAGPLVAAIWCWSGALSAEVSEPPCNLVPCNPLARIAASAVQPRGRDEDKPSTEFVADESLAWNLEHIWLTTAVATNDILHVTVPSGPLQSLTAQWRDPSRHRHLADYGKKHNDASAWNPIQICDFFEGKTAALPTVATRTVAVEDQRYFYFDATRADKTRTGVFGWRFEEQHLSLNSIENVSRLEFDVDGGIDTPLSSRAALTIDAESTDRLGTDLILHHFSSGPPNSVTRDGKSYDHKTAGVWNWDQPSATLTLFGQGAVAHTKWVIEVPGE